MKPSAYIETSVVSYYTARVSRDLVVAGHQEITIEWWEKTLLSFEVYVSQLVLSEATGGDPRAAEKRLEAIKDFPVLEMSDEVLTLARNLINSGAIPKEFADDAFHISVAAANGVEFLVTWNCKHIANARMRPVISRVIEDAGYIPPVICTPEELMGDRS